MENRKTIVQCDFDGTITETDLSFLILNEFGRSDWKKLFEDYQQGRLSLGRFNTEAFSPVKAARETLLDLVRKGTKVRPGFIDLVQACQSKGFRLFIVSNGLRFYIEDFLERLGIQGVEVAAAETEFHPDGLRVKYLGPDGTTLDNDFKMTYTDSFLGQGYRIIYLGDGSSDVEPAKKCQHIFAIDTLLEEFNKGNLSCTPFTGLRPVADAIRNLE